MGAVVKQTREEYYKAVRPQQVIFRLAQRIMDDLLQGSQSSDKEKAKIRFLARHQLYPELVKIVREYVEKKVVFKPGVDVRELGLERYAAELCARVRDGILPVAARDDARLLPVLNSFQPFTSTANVNYQTTRAVVELGKSHLNRAVVRSGWERRAIEILEDMDSVECYAPNDRQIGLIVPYEHEGIRHNYEPDFLVKLTNGKTVMLEIKGEKGRLHDPDKVEAKNAAAKKWVAAVNNLGRWGQWDYEMCEDPAKLRGIIESHVDAGTDNRPFKFVQVSDGTAWKSCVPLTSLRAAASKFGEEQLDLGQPGEWSDEWVTWDGAPRFEKGMFVARVLGPSMQPDIPDGAYCLFGQPKAGSRKGRTVLVWHEGIADPHTGGQYTVKVYDSEKRGSSEGEWEHVRITLKPRNPEYQPIVLEPSEEGQVRVIAELIQVLG